RPTGIGGHKLAGVPLRKIRRFLLQQAREIDADNPESKDGRFELFSLKFQTVGLSRSDDDKLGHLVHALIARGWIEELPRVNRQQRTQRFRLTMKGRQYALESAPLFKWPAGLSIIKPASRSAKLLDINNLTSLRTELARLGIHDHDDRYLDRYQQE